MAEICDNLTNIRDRIAEAEKRYGRAPGSVKLLAVSKTHPAASIEQLVACGQYAFGENYAQELASKAEALRERAIEWHFIGPLQSNKTRTIAAHAHWVHSVDRLKIAQRLSEQSADTRDEIQICLQINVSGEASKSGVEPAALPELAEQVSSLPRLRLRGLMAIPAPSDDFETQRRAFAAVRQAQESLLREGFRLDTLSMGMTGDMEAAIAEGATLVRIGTAIFGPRPRP